MVKRIVALTFLTLTLFTSYTQASPTDTEYIPSNKYFEIALNEISQAKQSIKLYMYLVSLSNDEPNSQVFRLLDSLVQAQQRGVAVQVILDQTLNFDEEQKEENLLQTKNQKAFEFLKKNNIPVFYDESENFTHAKTIVIDEETVIMGSSNWSKTAFTKNHEINALIRSKEFAKNVLQDLSSIKPQENVPYSVTPTVPIPRSFLLKRKLLGEMVSESDVRALDVTLYLYKTSSNNHDQPITLDYEELAKSLGIDHMPKQDYRRQIRKVIEKLRDKYKLIEFKKPDRNQDATVKLIKSSEDTKDPQNLILIPTTYWRYNWNKELSLAGKVVYLINLSFTGSKPTWSMSRKQISDTFNISESFISQGTMELRKKNLLEVGYDKLEEKRFDERLSNTYTPKALYDPEELKKRLKNLEQKHGKDKLNRATQIAGTVFEEQNPKTIEYLIDLENQYGTQIIEQASKKIQDKSPDNPKRSAGYLINTIKSMAEQTQKNPTL